MDSEATVRVAAVQWDVQRGNVEANLKVALDLLGKAAGDGVCLAVLPEMWASSFVGDGAAGVRNEVDNAEREIQSFSGDHGMLIVGSNYEFADGKMYNRARVYDRGKLVGGYRKIHLFSPMGEDRYFDYGDAALVVDTSLARLGVAICYDLRFPELIRRLYASEAQFLIMPAQWPEPRGGHWRLLARARALENQWFFIGCNRCGVEPSLVNGQNIHFPGNSILVDPTGEVLGEGNGETGVVAADIDLRQPAIVRRAIPVTKDRRDDVYDKIWGGRQMSAKSPAQTARERR